MEESQYKLCFEILRRVFESIPKKWQAKVINGLNKAEDKAILAALMGS